LGWASFAKNGRFATTVAKSLKSLPASRPVANWAEMVSPRLPHSLAAIAAAGAWNEAKWRILILTMATFAALC
jgi:hypothetical protein